jgi:hypothetical protein
VSRVTRLRAQETGKPIPAALVSGLPGFAATTRCLVDQGYLLIPHAAPVRSIDGRIAIRLVWRRRRDQAVTVVQQMLTGALTAPLQDALADAFDF